MIGSTAPAKVSGYTLDSAERAEDLVHTLASKKALRLLYEEYYSSYMRVLERCPIEGISVELGSGMGFAKDFIPSLVTSDIIPYSRLDRAIDAAQLPYKKGELRALFLLNSFHHLPDVEGFFSEATRCLCPGGRIFIIDQHHGWISRWVLRYAHHEPYDSAAQSWGIEPGGPLTAANGALAWLVFERDAARFRKLYPSLEVIYYRPHTPLRYWLAGGMKKWTLLPAFFFPLASWVDRLLVAISPNFGSFVAIEIVRLP